MFLEALGSIFHWAPSTVERSFIFCPVEPVNVRRPFTVWVEPASKFSCLLFVVQVKLLNVVPPEMVEISVPVKVIVPVELNELLLVKLP